jgi:hypothetical protein
MDAQLDPVARRRGRLTFALVAAAFLGTPLLAALWYAYGDAGQGARVNRGALIDPPRPVAGAAALGLEDRWTLVVHAPERCDAACTATLVMLRQVRLSFGNEIEKIEVVLVSGRPDADRAALEPEHPALRVLGAHDAQALVEAMAPSSAGRSIVIDPLGNAMLAYAPGTPPADVKSDLKRLLKNSQAWMRR